MSETMETCCPPQAAKTEAQSKSAACRSPARKGKKCMRPGRITNNGYLNFLREYRQKHCGLSAIEIVREGAKAWNALSCEEKSRYKNTCKGASMARKKKKRSMGGCGPRSRSRSRSRSSSPKHGRKHSRRGARRSRSRRRGHGRSCSGSRGSKRSRSAGRSRSRRGRSKTSGCQICSCSNLKPSNTRCVKADPVTSNRYLNFLRTLQRCCSGQNQKKGRKTSRRWSSLSPQAKKRYVQMVCRIARNNHAHKKAICREARKKTGTCS